jgi:RNA recognition motif-containing protein
MPAIIYVGNLPFRATADELRTLFSAYGLVESVRLITDRDTGRPRGFGFVTMDHGANEAIAALHGTDFSGRRLIVTAAKPREEGGAAVSWSTIRDGAPCTTLGTHRLQQERISYYGCVQAGVGSPHHWKKIARS